MPRASGTSWLAHCTVATRSGFFSTTVSPRACLTVIGNEASAAAVVSESELSASESELPPQAASTRAAAVATAPVIRRRRANTRYILLVEGAQGRAAQQ